MKNHNIEFSICQAFIQNFLQNSRMNNAFSDILKEFLENNDLTQTEFAKIVGIKQSQVSEWLKGKAKPGYDLLKKIALAFDISADYLLGLKE